MSDVSDVPFFQLACTWSCETLRRIVNALKGLLWACDVLMLTVHRLLNDTVVHVLYRFVRFINKLVLDVVELSLSSCQSLSEFHGVLVALVNIVSTSQHIPACCPIFRSSSNDNYCKMAKWKALKKKHLP